MSAKKLVLIHGFTGSPHSWSRVIKQLPPHVIIYPPSIYGHRGHPEKDASTFVDEVDRLAATIGHEAGEGAHLCGYSLGGRLALGLLVRHPELFSSATIVSAHPGLETFAEREQRIQHDETWAHILEQHGMDAFVDAWDKQPLFSSQKDIDQECALEQQEVRQSHSAIALAQSLRSLGLGRMPSFQTELRSVHLPVKIVVGELDDKFVGIGRHLVSFLPHAHLEIVPHAGHNVLLERPQVVSEAIRRALKGSAEEDEPRF